MLAVATMLSGLCQAELAFNTIVFCVAGLPVEDGSLTCIQNLQPLFTEQYILHSSIYILIFPRVWIYNLYEEHWYLTVPYIQGLEEHWKINIWMFLFLRNIVFYMAKVSAAPGSAACWWNFLHPCILCACSDRMYSTQTWYIKYIEKSYVHDLRIKADEKVQDI